MGMAHCSTCGHARDFPRNNVVLIAANNVLVMANIVLCCLFFWLLLHVKRPISENCQNIPFTFPNSLFMAVVGSRAAGCTDPQAEQEELLQLFLSS